MYLGTVHDGTVTYRVATMEKPPAPPAGGQAPIALGVGDSLPRSQNRDLGHPVVSSASQEPYARVGEDGVEYHGPERPDIPPGAVRVVLFGPQAQKVANSDEVQAELAAHPLKGREWKLLPVASDQNWGAASTQLVHALMDEHALAIVALDRDAAHLAEQLALKAFVPVVALSNDKALTSTNVPWIFRLPGGTTPAAALRLVKEAASRSGANPERLRDVLASGDEVAGVAFLPTGELRAK